GWCERGACQRPTLEGRLLSQHRRDPKAQEQAAHTCNLGNAAHHLTYCRSNEQESPPMSRNCPPVRQSLWITPLSSSCTALLALTDCMTMTAFGPVAASRGKIRTCSS